MDVAGYDDAQLAALLDAAPRISDGIGGAAVRLDIDGTPVFAKRVPLAEAERERTTANRYNLPPRTHLGLTRVGAPGMGAWREAAAMARMSGRPGFPQLYDVRVLPRTPQAPDEQAIAEAVAYWESDAIGQRWRAFAEAPWALTILCEYVPESLHEYLKARYADGTLADALPWAEAQLHALADELDAAGVVHYDGHIGNLLTDGTRIYLADFGLAAASDFEMDADERKFVARTAMHDRWYMIACLVNFVVTAHLRPAGPASRNACIERCAAGASPDGLVDYAADLVVRYAPVVAVVNAFYFEIFGTSRLISFPVSAIDSASRRSVRPWNLRRRAVPRPARRG
jgi:hypothetical protein